ncbi:MAG: alanine--tRNA ligase [Herpetosiphon sp.]
MKSAVLRRTFLDFFARHDHVVVPSGPLVPGNDPTLLFTNAGMVPFKDTFLGLEQRPYKLAVSVQKCMRVGGKHNDLEDVGTSPRHQTFFEMLGNFSFGGYFKREAIRLAWEFLTIELRLPINRLWVSIYQDDNEAEALWREVGVAPERILRFGEKDNFWAMGDTGPCGPSSEIHYYQGDHPDEQDAAGVNRDDEYLEFWNLVFMQYDRDATGTLLPLPNPSIDTGLGLDRMAAILQGKKNNYESDLFTPIIQRVIELAGGDEALYDANPTPYRIVADHVRGAAFLIADGVRPGNESRNYVLRRILRRAAYQGLVLKITGPFLAAAAEVVIEIMGAAYPELIARQEAILQTITEEEERFGRTLQSGVQQLGELTAQLKQRNETMLSGSDAFRLHDTYGFPLDLTAKILAEQGLQVDEAGFEVALAAQRERGRSATRLKRGNDGDFWARQRLAATHFTGYHELASYGHVTALVVDSDNVTSAGEGDAVQVVLDQSCFYAEGGGQVGDGGTLRGPHGVITVTDVQKPIAGLFVHSGVVTQGSVSVGEAIEQTVDGGRRRDVMRNHTATHLLHRALHDVLGEHAEQRGSLVAPDRLRFDFSHGAAIGSDALQRIEHKVNAWIRADTPVEANEMAQAEARALGAMALFGEKYGDRVRVVTIGCDEDGTGADPDETGPHPDPPGTVCSRELCGGTHVARTGEIGMFSITGESSIGSGLRRIEALTGRGVESLLRQQSATLREVANVLNTTSGDVVQRIAGLQGQLKQLQAELARAQQVQSGDQLGGALTSRHMVGATAVVAARVEVPNTDKLREAGDWLRSKLGSGVVVLGSVLNEKPQLLVMVTPDLVKQGVNAGGLVKTLAQLVGGRGGGRPDMAMAGGHDVARLDEALRSVDGLLA